MKKRFNAYNRIILMVRVLTAKSEIVDTILYIDRNNCQ